MMTPQTDPLLALQQAGAAAAQAALQQVPAVAQVAQAQLPAVQAAARDVGRAAGQGAVEGASASSQVTALTWGLAAASVAAVAFVGYAAHRAAAAEGGLNATRDWAHEAARLRVKYPRTPAEYEMLARNRAHVVVYRALRDAGVDDEGLALNVVRAALGPQAGGERADERYLQRKLSLAQREQYERLAQHAYTNPGLYHRPGAVRL